MAELGVDQRTSQSLARIPRPRRPRSWRSVASWTVLIVALAGVASPIPATEALARDTLRVPGDYATIQDAVDAAADGDTVLIAPGRYDENIVIGGKNITLASRFLTTGDPATVSNTIIDGGGRSFVVRVEENTGPGSRIVGLTLRDADDGVVGIGRFDFLNNRVTATADGIDYEGGRGTTSGGLVRDSVFEENRDDAIDLDGAVAVVIEDNLLQNNRDDGIEIRLHNYTGPTLDIVIRNNIITGNGEDGIQLIDDDALSDRFFRIEGNVLANNEDAAIGMMPGMNTKENFGGADLKEPVLILHNTIVGNNHGVIGGDNTVLVNNIVANNPPVGLKRLRADSIVAHSLLFGNGTDRLDVIADTRSLLFADPQLTAGFELAPTSPAVDAGVAFFEWKGSVILDLQPSDYSGLAPDLGAFELESGGPPCTIVGTSGDDILVGDDGTDVICGLGGDDIIHGKAGDDVLRGGGGDDRIFGGRGSDMIAGGRGNDDIFGNKGDDLLMGGKGRDRIHPGNGVDYVDGGSGSRDAVDYSLAARKVAVSLRTHVATGQGRDTLTRIENIVGSRFGDELVGDSRSNRIVAGAGPDSVWGRQGADHMRGGGGRDALYGGLGFDVARGGSGRDTCDAEITISC